MKHLVKEVHLNDDTWWELGGDTQVFIATAIGREFYYKCRDKNLRMELEFLDRDWNNQMQTIRLWVWATDRQMTWFWLNYSPDPLD